MPGAISHGFLRAACEAFPLTSEPSHTLALLALRRTASGLLQSSTQRLAAALEDWLRPRARGLSIEAIRALRDHAWFDGGPDELRLAKYVELLATRHVALRGGHVGLRTEPEPGQHLDHFRWLSLLMPPDLLVAAAAALAGIEPQSDHVDLCTPQLARILDHPVAETHLHVGAAFSFGLLWTGLMASLAHRPPDVRKLERGGTPPFSDGQRFLSMLQAAAISRVLLATYLWRRELRGEPASFMVFIDGDRSDLACMASRAAWPWGPPDFIRGCRLALRAVITGETTETPARLASLHRHIIGTTRFSEPASLDELLKSDPLAAWLVPAEGLALAETRFCSRAIRYLRHAGHVDDAFARTFWQYQRVRGLTYRHLTVEPGTAGLDWFQQHYDRISALRSTLDGIRFEAAARLSSRGVRLAAIEARTAPEPAWREIRDLTRHAAVALFPPEARPEVGLILHFLKQKESRRAGRTILNADPRQSAHGCRFGAYGYERLKEALAIKAALEHMHELLLVLRGIDVASSELAVPTWVFKPFLTMVRAASDRAAASLTRSRPRWNVRPLRATFHAGEDFRRLPEGIRRMHELLEFELLCAGDRIGHGIAAGTDASRWSEDNPITLQPAEDRLEDLLWEIDRYERSDFPADASRVERVRAEARDLALKLHRRTEDLGLLVAARRRRHDLRVLDRIGFPFTRGVVPADPLEKLVHEHLTDAGLFLRGRQLVEVRASEDERNMLAAAGRWLRRQIACREITVEANPSSNLLIADMDGIEEHPAFRFQPLRGDMRDDEEPIHLSINTDDPITFASSIGDEFAYLYGALLRRGIGSQQALAWLDQRREDGWRSRFTIAASADPEAARQLVRATSLPRKRCS